MLCFIKIDHADQLSSLQTDYVQTSAVSTPLFAVQSERPQRTPKRIFKLWGDLKQTELRKQGVGFCVLNAVLSISKGDHVVRRFVGTNWLPAMTIVYLHSMTLTNIRKLQFNLLLFYDHIPG